MVRISNSELHEFRRCRRKWYLAQVRKLVPRQERRTGPAPLGTWAHKCLQARLSGDWLATLERLHRETLDAGVDPVAEVDKQYRLVAAMLEGFDDWAAEEGLEVGWTDIFVEQIVEAPYEARHTTPFGEEVTLLAKIDRLVEVRDSGMMQFVDYKTVGSLGDLVKRETVSQTQFLHYNLCLSLQDMPRVDCGLYVMLRKVMRTATAKPPFYGTHEVRHNAAELEAYMKRLEGEIHDIIEVRRKLRDGVSHLTACYSNPTGDCSWECQFIKTCRAYDRGEDVTWLERELFTVGNPLRRYDAETEVIT